MKKFILVLVGVLLLATPVLAEGIDTIDLQETWVQLSEADKAAIAQLIAQKAAQTNTIDSAVTAEKVEPWLGLIDRLGSGLVKLAHDLGIEANELIKTPVGIMAMGLVIYHVMGQDLLGLGVGLLWLTVSVSFLTLFFFKSVVPIKEYAEVKTVGWTGKEKTRYRPIRRKVVFGDREGFNVDWIFVIMLAVNTLVTLIVLH